MYLEKLNFKSKGIKFANDLMYNYDLKTIREKNQGTNVSPNDKWKFCNSITLFHILNMSARAPLWHTTRKNANNVSKNMKEYQFQVECMSY